jgi:acetate kinase
LGLRLDPARNAAGATEIGVGPVRVLVLPADEELATAEAVYGLLRS